MQQCAFGSYKLLVMYVYNNSTLCLTSLEKNSQTRPPVLYTIQKAF